MLALTFKKRAILHWVMRHCFISTGCRIVGRPRDCENEVNPFFVSFDSLKSMYPIKVTLDYCPYKKVHLCLLVPTIWTSLNKIWPCCTQPSKYTRRDQNLDDDWWSCHAADDTLAAPSCDWRKEPTEGASRLHYGSEEALAPSGKTQPIILKASS